MKWITITEYVCHETGEILSKSEVERNGYYEVKKEVKTTIENRYKENEYGRKDIRRFYKWGGQTTLAF